MTTTRSYKSRAHLIKPVSTNCRSFGTLTGDMSPDNRPPTPGKIPGAEKSLSGNLDIKPGMTKADSGESTVALKSSFEISPFRFNIPAKLEP